MKLELKHIAPYLPYELRVTNGNEKVIVNSRNLDFTLIAVNEDFKPIFRPLSQLTQEIEHNGEKFVPIRELFQVGYNSVYNHSFDGEFTVDSALNDHLALKAIEHLDLPPDNPATREYNYGFTVELPYHFRLSCNGDFLTIPQFEIYEKLFEWHFDVFDLIPQGLAEQKIDA